MDLGLDRSNPASISPSCSSNHTARRSTLNFSRPLPQQLSSTDGEKVHRSTDRQNRFHSAGSSGEYLIPSPTHGAINLNPPNLTHRPRSPVSPSMLSPPLSPSRAPVSGPIRYSSGQYHRASSRLSIPRTRPGPRPNSIISITPADLPGISHYRPISYGQLKEICRVAERDDRHKFPSLSEEQGEFCSEPPDGGFMAWAHAASGFFITFNTLGLNMGFGAFQAYYSKVMLPTSSPSKIAWIGSFQIFASFGLFLLVGLLTSKGYFKLCFRGGAVGLMTTILLTGFCKTWWQFFLVQGVLMGCSMGLVFTSAVTVTTTYFSTNLGIATALAAVGSSFGGVIHPVIFNYSIHKVGFGWTLRIILLVNIVTMIFPLIIIRERPGVPRNSNSTMDWTMFTDTSYLLMAAGMFFAFWGVYFGFYFVSVLQAILEDINSGHADEPDIPIWSGRPTHDTTDVPQPTDRHERL
ncbi:hypothetical protein McanCB56680_005278 [Microsporum canis]